MILLHLFFIPLRILDELEGMCSDWKHKPYDDPFLTLGLWFLLAIALEQCWNLLIWVFSQALFFI